MGIRKSTELFSLLVAGELFSHVVLYIATQYGRVSSSVLFARRKRQGNNYQRDHLGVTGASVGLGRRVSAARVTGSGPRLGQSGYEG